MDLRARYQEMNKNLLALIILIVFWSSLVIFSGTLTSGFHFQDDHEIITINKSIDEKGFLVTLKSVIKEDLKIRFRSFYYLHRTTLVCLFGTNYLLWSLHNFLLAILTSFFLFLFKYKQGYRFINALLFPLLVLVGAQSTIWWRLGPAETIGIFMLSVSLLLLVNSVYRTKKYQLIISVVFMILASLSKESFLIIIPGYILIFLYLKWHIQTDKNIFQLLRNSLRMIIFLVIIVLVAASVILFVIGTNKTGYAGIDRSAGVGAYLTFINSHLKENEYTYLIIAGLFFLVQNIKSWRINLEVFNQKLMPYVINTLIMLAIIIPQVLLYYKSGLWDRYLLLLNFGLSLYVVFILEEVSRSASISKFTRICFILFIVLVIGWYFKSEAYPKARIFAEDGKVTGRFLTSVIENTNADDTILIVLDAPRNYEHVFSINTYLTIGANRQNLRFYNIEMQTNDEFENGLSLRFTRSFDTLIVKNLDNHYSCIAILPFKNNNEIKRVLDSNFVYRSDDFNDYSVYIRKGNGLDTNK